MAGVTENYPKLEVRAVVRFLQAEGEVQSEIRHRLVSVYGQNVFSRSFCVVKQTERWLNGTE
jgi:hypothetical protein